MNKLWRILVDYPLLRSELVRSAVWVISAIIIVTLGLIRRDTDAEYAFSSFVLIPVAVVAWICGRRNGLMLAALAAVTWGAADLLSDRAFSASWIPMVNAFTRCVTYILLVLVISSLKDALLHVEQMASCDGLTGLFNHRTFVNIGEEETARARRYRHSMAVVFLDLDNFKKLNDTQGHLAGDAALKATAAALVRILRSSDTTARIGGDEFAIVLPEISYESAAETGNKILEAIHHALLVYPPASASVGVAWYASPRIHFEEMLKDADNLMYEIKKQNKCGVMIRRFEDGMKEPDSA